jgi:trk system potassium uptake protein TrkH
MLLFGVNFNLYYLILIKQWRTAIKSTELWVYGAIVTVASVFIIINISPFYNDFGNAVRDAFFQVTTIISTSGYATVDYALWPAFAKTILVILMITGACAGSTAGGLKLSRVIISLKNIFRSIKKMVRPKSVNTVRVDGEILENTTLHAASTHISIYFAVLLFTVLVISIDGFDLETNFTAAVSCLSNIGPGLGAVGPAGNFDGFSYFSKLLLSFVMLIGRLEFIPVFVMLSPTTWKKH